MKLLVQKKYFDYVFTFLTVFQLTSDTIINSCRLYVPNNFDSINLLLWEYAARMGFAPYKDVFYPYGFLNYFRDTNGFAAFMDFLLAPLLITIFLFIFKKVYKNNLYAYIATLSLLVFVSLITGFETFDRYGILPAIVGICCYFFFIYKNVLPSKITFFFGIAVGLLFPLLIDQGLYSLILFVALLVTFSFVAVPKQEIWNTIQVAGRILGFFLIGFCLGFLPFLLYLLQTNAIVPFTQFFFFLSDISLLAKAPFFPTANTIDSIFLLLAGIIAIIFISFVFFPRRDKLTVNQYFLIGLAYSYLLLQQKSIIRSIAPLITFIGFLIFLTLFYELKCLLEKHGVNKIAVYVYLINLISFIIFFIGLTPVDSAGFFTRIDDRKCFTKNIEAQVTQDPTYNEVLHTIPSGNVFTFPGAPVFYLLTQQRPPYYATIYEASPNYAQENLIQYIQQQRVTAIFYDYIDTEIQDGVPNDIRGATLHQFIINNFSPQQTIGRFIIFKRNLGEKDLFKNPVLSKFPLLKQELTTLNMESIPSSEGYYKAHLLNNSNVLITYMSVNDLNNILKSKKITSNKAYLVFRVKSIDKKQLSLTLLTKDGLQTVVQYTPCRINNPCIIDLSRLPLFYRSRQIATVEDNDKVITKVSLYRLGDTSAFW